MKFCSNVYMDNRLRHREFQCHRSKVKVTWVFLVFFCVHDAATTRGQYLALSKAWWSCIVDNSYVLCAWKRSHCSWCLGVLCAMKGSWLVHWSGARDWSWVEKASSSWGWIRHTQVGLQTIRYDTIDDLHWKTDRQAAKLKELNMF